MPAEIDYKLNRFMDAQNGVYERALSELKAGRKRSHWMWFIFPQIARPRIIIDGREIRHSLGGGSLRLSCRPCSREPAFFAASMPCLLSKAVQRTRFSALPMI